MSTTVSETWDARIQRALTVLKWSKARLGLYLRVSERTISNWEDGECEPNWQSESRRLLEQLEKDHNIRERFAREQAAGDQQRQSA